MSTNIRLLKDGSRMVVVIDGTDATVAEAINGLIAQFLATRQMTEAGCKGNEERASGNDEEIGGPAESAATPQEPLRGEVPGLEPVAMAEISIPTEAEIERMETITEGETPKPATVSGGEYAGDAPAEALHRDGIKALASLFEHAKGLPQDSTEKSLIRDECRTYLSGSFAFEASKYTTREEKLDFLDLAAKITPINSLTNGLGLMEFDRFKDFASSDDVDQLFKTVITSLVQRGN